MMFKKIFFSRFLSLVEKKKEYILAFSLQHYHVFVKNFFNAFKKISCSVFFSFK